ncbi:MAG: aldehyde:ferredoxin oxidoreductase [Candidatus Anoxymicrobium japonicum]|uniref:Aldehyde:ferredoxin oxidoreductase n=1 Tax=Candidatus Anoxymicrobium japonicum TaxID=2013648 RepID=A0A2N3G6E6_9ACTN|nr:MAG: aldehyde:ferredoxin oxidoreductase [Candidatus Anoxymicrobium japonicum]
MGYTGTFLDVNLSTGQVSEYEVSDDLREKYLGGKGLAARILYDTCEKGVDPLGPDNVLIVNTGPLVGSGAPCTSRFNVTTKSPLTGGGLSSNCGGNFGMFLKKAGLDGIIIRGKAEKPTWIHVENGEVELRDASGLWGLDTEETQEKLPGDTGKIVIGPAGENGVPYACIISQERAAGRGGAGAVMGSKNVKAVTAKGRARATVAAPEKFKDDVKKWIEILRGHPATGEMMPSYGTAVFVNRCNATNTMPTHNFQRGTFDKADAVSGETLAETLLTKNFGCSSCVIKCGRRVNVGGKDVKGPEYETIGLLGPNIENADLARICEWNYKADLMGIDTITLGNVLGFAMELTEKGLFDSTLEFGKTEGIAELIEDIAYRRGVGAQLAEGVRRMSEKYGGKEFAMHVKGMELAAYEPRGAVGHGLGYAIANRGGCHIAGGYMVYFEANGPLTMDPLTTHAKPQLTALLQILLDALSDAGSCQFTGFTAVPRKVLGLKPSGLLYRIAAKALEGSGPVISLLLKYPKALAFVPPMDLLQHPKAITDLTGMKMTFAKYIEIGQRTYLIERLFNIREGITGVEDTLPRRSTDELQTSDPRSRVPLAKMLPVYYRIRGLDHAGAPTAKTLAKLGVRG